MRKYITSNGTFYYPEESINLIDTEEVKIIVENPVGYVEGDLVRMFYTFAVDNIQVGVDTFEMFSPLVKDGAILRAIFYLPLSVEFVNEDVSSPGYVYFYIKVKGSTDFSETYGVLNSKSSIFFLTQNFNSPRSNPIPVFFFSERGAGLFENTILNRQFRVTDTNFSSVAIRQDKFNPYDMEVGGRNLLKLSDYSSTKDLIVFNNVHIKPDTTYTLSDYNGIFERGRVSILDSEGLDLFIIWDWSSTYKKRTFTTPGSIVEGDYAVRFWKTGGHTEFEASDKTIKLEKGTKATDWTPAPEDYEVTEVVSGADLAVGLAKFDASYAFKLLDDSEWVAKKLVCPENYIQLFWGEPRSETRFSFWFKIKEIEKSSEAWGEVEHYRELRAGADVKERRKDVTKYRFPKTKLRLTSGVFRQDIIDKLKGIVHSTTIYKYNPYTKLNEGRGVIAQVTEVRRAVDGLPTPQEGVGHFRLNDIYTHSNTIKELINSPESIFDLEFSFKGNLRGVHFIQNRDDEANNVLIANSITEPDFTKKTFNGSITIDRSMKVKPLLRFRVSAATPTEIKDIYIKGSLGGVEDVEVEIATMNIIPHQDGESEMELTVISDDFRKPDYLYF